MLKDKLRNNIIQSFFKDTEFSFMKDGYSGMRWDLVQHIQNKILTANFLDDVCNHLVHEINDRSDIFLFKNPVHVKEKKILGVELDDGDIYLMYNQNFKLCTREVEAFTIKDGTTKALIDSGLKSDLALKIIKKLKQK